MCPFVISEHVTADNAFNFRIISREEVGITEQHPVKEDNIERLHTVEHDDEPDKKLQKSEAVFYSVPSTQDERSRIHEERKNDYYPAYRMCAFEPLFSVGNNCKDIFVSRAEESLILNKGDAAVKDKKICSHKRQGC